MTLSYLLRLWILCGLFINSGLSCQSQQSSTLEQVATKVKTDEPAVPGRRDLARSLFRSKQVTLVYGDQLPIQKVAFERFMKKIEARDQSELKVKILPASKITPEELKNDNLLLMGSWASNVLFQKFATTLPFQFSKKYFKLGEAQYSASDQSLIINVFPNPINPQNPISIIYGNVDEKVIDLIEQRLEQPGYSFFWNSWGYEIFEDGERIKMGNFNDSDWQLGEGIHYDFSNKSKTEWQSDHFLLETHHFKISNTSAQQVLDDLELRRLNVQNFFSNKTFSQDPIQYKLYDRSEHKGLATRNTLQAHIDVDKNRIFEVKNNLYNKHESIALNEFLVLKNIGRSKTKGLQLGLATFLTTNWQENGYQYWASRLLQSNNFLPLKELLNNNLLAESSELITAPLLASFVDYLIQRYSKEMLIKSYLSWQPLQGEIGRLEKEWHQHIRTNYPSVKKENSLLTIPYLKGFNFAHEGYAIFNGYGSQLAEKSLDKISGTGSNAVAIIPYSYMRNPNLPKPLPLMNRAGTEDDAGVIRSSYDAQQLGMTTMLKPQIWLRGSWPGDVKMASEAEWQQWFDYYYRWMLHYALLAEMYHFDQLCIGVEFAQATQLRPEDWRQLIRKLRGVYSGPITYAANWGDEFEKITLWTELDFIGINCYYPMGKEAELTQDQLNQRFEEILSKVEKVAKKYGKSVVFTEIGFRNVDQCWINPHAEADGRQANQNHQLMCYKAVAKGLEGKAWCKGILWWKWPSYMDYSKRNDTSFTPSGKAAEAVVETMFK